MIELVYVVVAWGWDTEDAGEEAPIVTGVFSTKELAEDHIAVTKLILTGASFFIVERQVDLEKEEYLDT